jgi:hypothetical protein
MSGEPTTAYFSDPQKHNANTPQVCISRVDDTVAGFLGELGSSTQKLYLVNGLSNELEADDIVKRIESDCGAEALSTLVSTGLDYVQKNADISSILRTVAKAEKGDHEVTVSTIDAPGRSEFENCVSTVVRNEVAQLSKASGEARPVGKAALAVGAAAVGFAALLV